MKKCFLKLFAILSLFIGLMNYHAKAQIIIPQNEDVTIGLGQSVADHYPSILTVSNLPTKITGFAVRVSLTTGTTPPPFLDVILEGPGGQVSYLLSDVGNLTGVTNEILTIFDTAPLSMPTPTNGFDLVNPFFKLTSGFFKPTDGNIGADIFPAPAPAGPYPVSLAGFKDTIPNGDWKLYATLNVPNGIEPVTITKWELIFFVYPENDYNGDGFSDYVLKKKKNIFVVNETNAVPITKDSTPNASIKAKIVGGADLDGDHISDLIVKKGKTVQGLKGPGFTTPIYTLEVKRLNPVASGDFNGDLLPDLYFQKKTSLLVATNTGSGFSAPFIVADKTLPKKFKVFGALSGRLQPVVLAQSKTTVARLVGPSFSSPVSLLEVASKKVKASAVGQFVFDATGSTIILQQKKELSFSSPFLPGVVNSLLINELKGAKVVAPR